MLNFVEFKEFKEFKVVKDNSFFASASASALAGLPVSVRGI